MKAPDLWYDVQDAYHRADAAKDRAVARGEELGWPYGAQIRKVRGLHRDLGALLERDLDAPSRELAWAEQTAGILRGIARVLTGPLRCEGAASAALRLRLLATDLECHALVLRSALGLRCEGCGSLVCPSELPGPFRVDNIRRVVDGRDLERRRG